LDSAPHNLVEQTLDAIENKKVMRRQMPLQFDLYGKRIVFATGITFVFFFFLDVSILKWTKYASSNENFTFKFEKIVNVPFEIWAMTLIFVSFIYLDRFLEKGKTSFV
ncbi:MAG: hypothetical protein AAGH81_18005, partial [Bacteroidota bacterium]